MSLTGGSDVSDAASLKGHPVLTKVLRRAVPFLFLCYVANYLDRVNVGFAALTMNKDLGLSPSAFGWGAGLFFAGYFVFQIPSNLILHRIGARVWLGLIMIIWGIIAALSALVTGPLSFGFARFLLGVAEGGFVPGVFFYLTNWFPNSWRARATATFLVGIPVASIIGSPLSGAILSLQDWGGLKSWQWLLVLEGVPSIILGAVCLFVLSDRPELAPWLTREEKTWLTGLIAAERRVIQDTEAYSVWEVLSDRRVVVMALINFCSIIGGFGVQLWMPQIIKGFGLSNWQVGLLTAVPYIFAAIGMILWARSSDRAPDRTWHVVGTTLLAAVGLAMSAVATSPALSLAALTAVIVGTVSFQATFWAVPATFLSGRAAAVGIAFVVAFGNLGGLAGPYLIGRIKEATNSYSVSLLVLTGFMLVASALMLHLGNPATKPAARRSDVGASPPVDRLDADGSGAHQSD
jgi:MFS transporter, ACS family, tartrate transporter